MNFSAQHNLRNGLIGVCVERRRMLDELVILLEAVENFSILGDIFLRLKMTKSLRKQAASLSRIQKGLDRMQTAMVELDESSRINKIGGE